jgi:hypothetical protein
LDEQKELAAQDQEILAIAMTARLLAPVVCQELDFWVV